MSFRPYLYSKLKESVAGEETVRSRSKIMQWLAEVGNDESFLKHLKWLEAIVAKILSIAMIIVLLVAVKDLVLVLGYELFSAPYGAFKQALIDIFGLFLTILIALEILENITAYLSKNGVQVELVVATALIAVARKLIIFDLSKSSGIDLMGLALAILALSVSYWLVRRRSKRLF